MDAKSPLFFPRSADRGSKGEIASTSKNANRQRRASKPCRNRYTYRDL